MGMKPRKHPDTDSTLATVFSQLRALLAAHDREMVVEKDGDGHYDLYAPGQYMGRRLHFAGVKLGKTGVFLHFFPSYAFPAVNAKSSAQLKERRHGKNCYNFREIDPALFADVGALIERGLLHYRNLGFLER